MRTVHFPSFGLTAIAVVAFAVDVPAQAKASALLNTLEVQRLVTRGEPADNAQLAAHFNALADRYGAEARSHTAMARGYSGNPNRNTGAGMSAHCKQLAALNTKSVTTLRELAAYHEKQAAGVAATPPSDAARFQSGKGAREPNEKELADLAATARTPSEHGTLQEYFRTLAKRYASDADAHAAFANTYRGTRIAQVAVYHDNLARASRNAAKEATAAAEMHKEMAVSTR